MRRFRADAVCCLIVLSADRSWAAWLLASMLLGTNRLDLSPLLLLRPTALGCMPWSTAGIDPALLEPGDVGGSIARGEIGSLIRTPLGSPLLDHLRALRSPSRGPIDVLVAYLEEPELRIFLLRASGR